MNKNYKNCEQGHFYPSTFSSCPHCQNQSSTVASGNVGSVTSDDSDKTALMGNGGRIQPASDPSFGSVGSSSQGATVQVGMPFSANEDQGRTIVVSSGPRSGQKESDVKPTPSRKLVGWLVSYTISELGVDFRLYEGQNNIGRDTKSTVRITEDSAISSQHATILNRGGQFYLRDEMSTNPSFVNGEEVMPGNTVKLNDGDSIMLGKTVLMLRVSILNNPNQP